MAPCTHGFPKPANCIECMEEGNMPTAKKSIHRDNRDICTELDNSAPNPWTAQFGGHCLFCDDEITKNELIVRMSDQTYQHAWHYMPDESVELVL